LIKNLLLFHYCFFIERIADEIALSFFFQKADVFQLFQMMGSQFLRNSDHGKDLTDAFRPAFQKTKNLQAILIGNRPQKFVSPADILFFGRVFGAALEFHKKTILIYISIVHRQKNPVNSRWQELDASLERICGIIYTGLKSLQKRGVKN
jgi:hypothetical protein